MGRRSYPRGWSRGAGKGKGKGEEEGRGRRIRSPWNENLGEKLSLHCIHKKRTTRYGFVGCESVLPLIFGVWSERGSF